MTNQELVKEAFFVLGLCGLSPRSHGFWTNFRSKLFLCSTLMMNSDHALSLIYDKNGVAALDTVTNILIGIHVRTKRADSSLKNFYLQLVL